MYVFAGVVNIFIYTVHILRIRTANSAVAHQMSSLQCKYQCLSQATVPHLTSHFTGFFFLSTLMLAISPFKEKCHFQFQRQFLKHPKVFLFGQLFSHPSPSLHPIPRLAHAARPREALPEDVLQAILLGAVGPPQRSESRAKPWARKPPEKHHGVAWFLNVSSFRLFIIM